MKTLIFSDSHLSHHFNQAQFDLLQRVILSADRVIINGDFWDQYLTKFDRFVQSSWSDLFPLLKARNTIYISGNHDQRKKMDERWQLFATELKDELDITIGQYSYHIEHGHRFDNILWPVHQLLTPFKVFYPFLDRLEQGGHILSKPFKAYMKVENKYNNRMLVKYSRRRKQPNHWHVFGHTHVQLKSDSAGYLNSGWFRCGSGQWIIIEDDNITTHGEMYSK